MQYGEDGSPHSFLLEISWPEDYPECLPTLSLDAFYNKHLYTPLKLYVQIVFNLNHCMYSYRKAAVKQEIISKLTVEAEANIGCAMTYTIVEWVKEHVEELLANQPTTTTDASDEMSHLDIADKV